MTRVKQALNRIRDKIEGQTVLEVACDCAEFSIAASEIAKKVNCIDIDSSRLNKEISACSNVAFDLIDATDMKYNDKTFDTVVIYNAIAHLDTVFPSVLKECDRVLKTEGGIFIISSFKIDKTVIQEDLIPYLLNTHANYTYWADKVFAYVQIGKMRELM